MNGRGDLARNTQDVVAVANRLEVVEPPMWDFSREWSSVSMLWRDFVRTLPFFVLGLLILAVSFGAAMLATRVTLRLLRIRIQARLLRNVIARSVGALVVWCGFYLVLRVAGLTQLALTLVGGTGLIVGIAFRDITENFLSSVFLSMQRLFETGDLVEISGVTGYVQRLNIRTTILMTLDGNLTQIPNNSWLKVRSSVIRLVKRAFQQPGFSLPDEAREVVFPRGVPVTMLEGKPDEARAAVPRASVLAGVPEERDVFSTKAEAGLHSESAVIEEQAQQAELLQEGENLLPSSRDPVAPPEGPTKPATPPGRAGP